MAETIAIEADSLTAGPGKRTVLRGVSLCPVPGTLTALIGPNGAGKTTLLRALAGTLPLQSGQVRIAGTPISEFKRPDLARKVALLPQTRDLAWDLSVLDVVSLGRFPFGARLGALSETGQAAVRDAMQTCDLGGFENRRVSSLSGGEQARVHLARTLATEAPIMLLDEPAPALDLRHQHRLFDALKRVAKMRNATILFSVHSPQLAKAYADNIIALKSGIIAYDGPADTLSRSDLKGLFDLDDAATAMILGGD